MKIKSKLPFVLFQIKDCMYAVPSEHVREILILPNVVSVPNAPKDIRGVINLRGKVIKLIDLRVRLGLTSARSEVDDLIQLLQDREQDHRNWITELEACVRERRPFSLARDPHQCKFGLWYDHFKTDDSLLKMTLKHFDKPHQLIHAAANEVLELAGQGNEKEALALLDSRRNNELAFLINTFGEARRILREHYRELAVVVARNGKQFAMSIDGVESVERIPDESIEPLPETMSMLNTGLRCRVAKRLKTNQTILLLEDEFLFTSEAVN